MSYLFLSHRIDKDTPGFGGISDFNLKVVKNLSEGASCNVSRIEMSMHLGTHVDAPFHFCESGGTVDEIEANQWVFRKIAFVRLKDVLANSIIDHGSWCEELPHDLDLLLLKTGFEELRGSSLYWQQNPGLSPALGDWLRVNRPTLRALGFDFISASSFTNRKLGRLAHRAFLEHDKSKGRPILLMEDLHLKDLHDEPIEVIGLPLRVFKADGAPMTIIAKIGVSSDFSCDDTCASRKPAGEEKKSETYR